MDQSGSDQRTDHQSVDSSEKEENISIPTANKTLNESLEYVFDNEICTDVTFLVGPESTPIKSHKVILISRSSVFRAMFDGPIAEKGDIKIEDANKEHFKIFLRFLYTDSAVLTADCVVPMVYLAEKYDILSLKKKGEGFLEENLQIENACKTLEIANTYNMTGLCKACFDFIGLMSEKCLKSQRFLEVKGETVDMITKSETLNCQEELIYDALNRWVGEECHRKMVEVDDVNKKNVIQKYLKNIRFPLMSHQYITHEVPKHHYLTSEEILGILNSDKDPQDINFNSNPRLGFTYDNVVRFEKDPEKLVSSVQGGEVNAISFKLSHNSWLYGALIYGSSTKQQAIVQLRVARSKGVKLDIAGVKRNVEVGPDNLVHTILFEAPVYIPADEGHTIYLGLFGADTNEFYGSPATSNPIYNQRTFAKKTTPGFSFGGPSLSVVIHKNDGIEKYIEHSNTPARKSIIKLFRYKSVCFYNYCNLKNNRSSIYNGQIPGLLLF